MTKTEKPCEAARNHKNHNVRGNIKDPKMLKQHFHDFIYTKFSL